jgi:aminoglycoside phosphotransferase (APT) family kinase protein
MTIETTLTSDTIPVRETHRFDLGSLERYLAGRIPGFAGPVTVSQFQGGQSNPTYRLSTPGTVRLGASRRASSCHRRTPWTASTGS